jgi:hypothetical protein
MEKKEAEQMDSFGIGIRGATSAFASGLTGSDKSDIPTRSEQCPGFLDGFRSFMQRRSEIHGLSFHIDFKFPW